MFDNYEGFKKEVLKLTKIDLNFYNVNPPKTKQKKRISLEELEDNFDGE